MRIDLSIVSLFFCIFFIILIKCLISVAPAPLPKNPAPLPQRVRKGIVKRSGNTRHSRRVSFDPLALLLDASLEGELDLVIRTASEVRNFLSNRILTVC